MAKTKPRHLLVIVLITSLFVMGGILLLSHYSKVQVEGIVPNEKTAISLAEIIFIAQYGESVTKFRPFVVEYDSQHACWIVAGTLPDGVLGGAPQITIAQRDGRVLGISHGK